MLSEVELRLFKCFEHLRLPLRPLTVLSGLNASGKSSVIQALALLHQTMHGHEWSTRLILNGSAVQLGTVSDVVDEVYGRRDAFEIGLADDDVFYRWAFGGEPGDMSVEVVSVSVEGEESRNPEFLRHLLPREKYASASSLTTRLRNLAYITAERVGPREVYQLEDQRAAAAVGPRGEQAISLLYSGRDEQALPGLALGTPRTRLSQVIARMGTFFPGFSMSIRQVPDANYVTLGLRTSTATGHHRPIHTGFGVTQTLPVVVAALSASEGDILLIENPEVHLHPMGQALMGQFLAEAANAGVQVIVETHSDHVLNGVRRSVKAGGISSDDVAIHFFRPRVSSDDMAIYSFRSRVEGEAQVTSPQINQFGGIDDWPDGFFDQFDRDMRFFAGWGA